MNTVVVTAKFGNVSPFVANQRPLSCCCQGLSLSTCCCCCRCNNYALEQRVIFILGLTSFCHRSQYPKIKYADEKDVCLPLDQRQNVLLFLLLFLFVFRLVVGYVLLFWIGVVQEKSDEDEEPTGLLILMTINCLNA